MIRIFGSVKDCSVCVRKQDKLYIGECTALLTIRIFSFHRDFLELQKYKIFEEFFEREYKEISKL